MEVKQGTFATMCGVSRAAVCTKIKNKTLIVNSAGMLDTDNPVNRAYLDKKQGQRRSADFGLGIEHTGAAAKPVDYSEMSQTGTAGEMLNMTIRELVSKYGSMANVEKYVKILRDLTAADEKDQRIQERRLIQIPKDFVQSSVTSLLETLMNKLLDLPERIADQAIAFVQADVDTARQKIILLLNDDISAAIADSKNQINNKIQNMKGKYSQEDSLRDIISESMEKAE
jgi:hypothetical protein